MKNPIAELQSRFPTEASIRVHLAKLRWPDGKVVCPRCGSKDVLAKDIASTPPSVSPFECKDCKRARERKNSTVNTSLFNVMTLTLLGDTRNISRFVTFLYIHLHLKAGSAGRRKVARSVGLSQTASRYHLYRVACILEQARIKVPDPSVKLDDALKKILTTPAAVLDSHSPTRMVA